jgi:patatin-like phospholipase
MARPRIGLALGSGSARGWAHIGVIDSLIEAGIQPDIVCGASMGALSAPPMSRAASPSSGNGQARPPGAPSRGLPICA